jgi:hypothetical protein
MARCEAHTSKGTRCKAAALKDGPFCALHAAPDTAKKLGQRRGQLAREKAVLPSAAFELNTPQAVAGMLEAVCNRMLEGALDRSLASTAAYIGATLLKAQELEERLPNKGGRL